MLDNLSDKEYNSYANPDVHRNAYAKKDKTKTGLAKATSLAQRARRKQKLNVVVIPQGNRDKRYKRVANTRVLNILLADTGFSHAASRLERENRETK